MQAARVCIHNERPVATVLFTQGGPRIAWWNMPDLFGPSLPTARSGLGSFLGGLFRLVRPVLWGGKNAVGRETLRTCGRILSDLADDTVGDVKPRHIISKHVGDSAQTLIQKLRGKGLKSPARPRSRGLPPKKKARPKAAKTTKRDIFP